jgi:hypothetical protein
MISIKYTSSTSHPRQLALIHLNFAYDETNRVKFQVSTRKGQSIKGTVVVNGFAFDEPLTAYSIIVVVELKVQPELGSQGMPGHQQLGWPSAGAQLVPQPWSGGAAAEANDLVRVGTEVLVIVTATGKGVGAATEAATTGVQCPSNPLLPGGLRPTLNTRTAPETVLESNWRM